MKKALIALLFILTAACRPCFADGKDYYVVLKNVDQFAAEDFVRQGFRYAGAPIEAEILQKSKYFSFAETVTSNAKMISTVVWWTSLIFFLLFILGGIRIVRPTHRGLIETLGKYSRFANPGLNFVIPGLQKIYLVNVTEYMADAEPQEIITKDNLNAEVDAQVYYKVKADEDSVKKSVYNVDDVDEQIVSLAKTSLRNIIGTMSLKDANSGRSEINKQLFAILEKETSSWGIEIVRTELKEITPPKDVQDAMNKIVKSESEKIAAIDIATALETKADGEARAKLKLAEAQKKAAVLEAQGEQEAAVLIAKGKAEAITTVNEAATKSFNGQAVVLRQIEMTETALGKGTKYVIPAGGSLMNVLGEGVISLDPNKKQ